MGPPLGGPGGRAVCGGKLCTRHLRRCLVVVVVIWCYGGGGLGGLVEVRPLMKEY
jgi:hypothetical protein